MDDLEALLEHWVALIQHGREHGLHIEAGPNRPVARETLAAAITDDRVFVALERAPPTDDDPSSTPARDGDTPPVVGFCSLSVESGGFRRDADLGTIENLYVDPAHRGEGLGSALLAAGERRLRERDVDAITVETMAADDAALSFYQAHGYEPHRLVVERAIDEPPTDDRPVDDGSRVETNR